MGLEKKKHWKLKFTSWTPNLETGLQVFYDQNDLVMLVIVFKVDK